MDHLKQEPMLPKETGWIEVICGSMYSGKTEELIRRLRRAMIARLDVLIIKPRMDNRFSEDHLVSHSDHRIPSQSVTQAGDILELASSAQVIGIDEAQFFGSDLVNVCQTMANQGKRVIVAGLDQDYRNEPFEPMPQLLTLAEYITKTLAICMQCGNPANRTQRITQNSERVLVGGAGMYEARCRRCHTIPE
jgi:thymidine kinase